MATADETPSGIGRETDTRKWNPCGQDTQPTSKSPENKEFALAHSVNLRQRSEASMRIDAAATQPVLGILCHQVMPFPKHPK